MDRDVSVNAEYRGDYAEDAENGFFGDENPYGASAAAVGTDYGPCLYLGPSGQRCSRKALEGGFCALHQPGAKRPESTASHTKRAAAVVGALAALLPWLIDLIRELLRLIFR
jgi:hypothetical protein